MVVPSQHHFSIFSRKKPQGCWGFSHHFRVFFPIFFAIFFLVLPPNLSRQLWSVAWATTVGGPASGLETAGFQTGAESIGNPMGKPSNPPGNQGLLKDVFFRNYGGWQQPLNLDLFFGIISWVGIGGEGTLTFRCNWDLPGLLQGFQSPPGLLLSRYLEKNLHLWRLRSGGKTQSIIKTTKHLNYVVFSLADRVYFLLQIIRI